MFRPGDDPTLLAPDAVAQVLARVDAAVQVWSRDRQERGEPAPDLAIVFGSFGCTPPRARAASDVDLAVGGDRPLSFLDRLDLAVHVGEATGREVDVIDLAETHGPLLYAALCGKVLHESGVTRRAMHLSRHWIEEEDFGRTRDAMLAARRARWLGAT